MANKIFSGIAKNRKGLEQVYNDSGTLDVTFGNIRELASSNPINSTIVNKNIYRIEPVYNLYTLDPNTPLSFKDSKGAVARSDGLSFTLNQVQRGSQIYKTRRSAFYKDFPTVNSLLRSKQSATNGTLIEIKPYDNKIPDQSTMRQNSQALPLVSGPRDVERFSKYFTQASGIRFIASQQRLQAGNTFGQTRLYNLLSVPTAILNYSNSNLSNLLERPSRIILNDTVVNEDLTGRLQKESVITIQGRLRTKFISGPKRPASAISNFVNSVVNTFVRGLTNKITVGVPGIFTRNVGWLNARLGTNFSIGNTVNLGQVGRQINTIVQTGNAILRGLGGTSSTLIKDQTAYDALYNEDLWPIMKETDGTIRSHQSEKAAYITRAKLSIAKATENLNNRNTATRSSGEEAYDDYRSSVDYTDSVQSAAGTSVFNGVTSARYMQDTFNNEGGLIDGKYETGDYIKLKVQVPGVYDKGIYFRAFIEDFNHTAKGEYSDTRYVGRPERFITYKGMNRSLTFSLYLIAFSEQEIGVIWDRANMLNKLVYPIDVSGGFMTPPLVKLTVGNIIVEQPGYVENIDIRLSDVPWDINEELTQVIKLNMTYNIIEKEFITQQRNGPTYEQPFGKRNLPAVAAGPAAPAPTLADAKRAGEIYTPTGPAGLQ